MIGEILVSIFSIDVLPILVSIGALLFAIGSFWWMHWRKGRLYVSPSRSYAAHGSEDGPLVLKLPLVLFNSGALPIVVQNLRVHISQNSSSATLNFIATSPSLSNNEGRELAVQFPVLGRKAVSNYFEFQRRPGRFVFSEGAYRIRIEALLDRKQRWRKLVEFDLFVSSRSISSINSRLIVHDNSLGENNEFDFGS